MSRSAALSDRNNIVSLMQPRRGARKKPKRKGHAQQEDHIPSQHEIHKRLSADSLCGTLKPGLCPLCEAEQQHILSVFLCARCTRPRECYHFPGHKSCDHRASKALLAGASLTPEFREAWIPSSHPALHTASPHGRHGAEGELTHRSCRELVVSKRKERDGPRRFSHACVRKSAAVALIPLHGMALWEIPFRVQPGSRKQQHTLCRNTVLCSP